MCVIRILAYGGFNLLHAGSRLLKGRSLFFGTGGKVAVALSNLTGVRMDIHYPFTDTGNGVGQGDTHLLKLPEHFANFVISASLYGMTQIACRYALEASQR